MINNGYRVVFNKAKEATFQNFKVRDCRDNEVKVKVQYSLISNGTERLNFRGLRPEYPFIPGYSSVGYVCEIGKGINQDIISYGDRVFVIRGGHQSYNIQTLNKVIKIPDGLDLDLAVFARAASFPLTGLRRACVQPGENLVVVGLGLLGLFGVQLCNLLAPFALVAVGNREVRRFLAKTYGADVCFDPKINGFEDQVLKYFEDISGKSGSDVVIETSGSLEAIASAVKYSAMRGRIVLGGLSNQPTNDISMYQLFNKGINLIGGSSGSRLSYHSYYNNFTERADLQFILKLLNEQKLSIDGIEPSLENPENAHNIYKSLDEDYEFPLACILDWTDK